MVTELEQFIDVHQFQLTEIPESLWESLYVKLKSETFDAGDDVELHYGDPMPGYSLHLKSDKTLKKHSKLFLTDDAWTTTLSKAKEDLRNMPALVDRLESMMGLCEEDSSDEEEDLPSADLIELVASQANVSHEEAKEALVAEDNEIVNAIMRLTLDAETRRDHERLHNQVIGQMLASGTPQEKEANERIDHIYRHIWSYLNTYTYTMLNQQQEIVSQQAWYVLDEVGSAICHSSRPNIRCVPFIFSPSMIPYTVVFPIEDIQPGEQLVADFVPKSITRDQDRQAYLHAYKKRSVDPVQPVECVRQVKVEKPKYPPRAKMVLNGSKVFTDMEEVQKQATCIDQWDQADMIWTQYPFKGWSQLKEGQYVNQYENEHLLTHQGELARLIQRSLGSVPWYPTTFNIKEELSEFVTEFQKNKQRWIIKAVDDQRGVTVSDNLAELIRQYDHAEPKIVQHYINPCLYNGKKFNLRYFVLVTDEIHVQSSFKVRLSEQKFNLTEFHEGHYSQSEIDDRSFIYHMNKHFGIQWQPIETKIHHIIKGNTNIV
ncbi:tubulin-tyrosine ligase family-domain-containing protein [Pilobolus umbonatus]|nr:tubulin-tyrosine ligase family-domain-containing protein [Pilobolus umbonatus]